jgi:hypothetical protein
VANWQSATLKEEDELFVQFEVPSLLGELKSTKILLLSILLAKIGGAEWLIYGSYEMADIIHYYVSITILIQYIVNFWMRGKELFIIMRIAFECQM